MKASRRCGSTSPTWSAARARPTGRRWRSTPGVAAFEAAASTSEGGRTGVGERQVLRRADGVDGGRRGHAGGRPRVPGIPAPSTRASRSGFATSICTASRCRCCSCEGTRDPFATAEVLGPGAGEARRRRHAAPGRGRRPLVRNARAPNGDPREVAAVLAPVAAAFMREHGSALMPRKNRRDPAYFEAPEAPAGARRRADVGAGAGLRGAPRRRTEGVPVSRVRPRRCAPACGTWWWCPRAMSTPAGTGTPSAGGGTAPPGPLSPAACQDVSVPPGYDGPTWQPTTPTRRRRRLACIPVSESKRLPCDLCGHPMEPEHAHYRCPSCHYILPCCGW